MIAKAQPPKRVLAGQEGVTSNPGDVTYHATTPGGINVQAHAVDIERCTECPFVEAHTKRDRSVPCTHPLRLAVERLAVDPWRKPPKHCPMREKLTVLRVTS